jgi:hypothetical protein
MKNKTQKNPATATKKESGQPTYGDQPWQTPQENDRKDLQGGDFCGCDSDKGNRKETTKRH